ncbi:MAG: M23 family metallopeptidase [Rickettsiales bacterium]|jgi:murein DD-endopeptidase MepM/ murein hydrolase activator NlpD|nr:M23 family metallopeptidase [Rickettsiales bacterium]
MTSGGERILDLWRNCQERLEDDRVTLGLAIALATSLGLSLLVWVGYLRTIRKSAGSLEVRETGREVVVHGLDAVGLRNSLETRKHRLRRGENLFDLLVHDLGFSSNDVISCVGALRRVFNVRRLRAGQEISLGYRTIITVDASENLDTRLELEELRILDDQNSEEIVVLRDQSGKYWPRRTRLGATTYYDRFFVEIENSLYADAILAGVPAEVVVDLINLYSFDVDFQRDIRSGDRLEIIFESQSSEASGKVRSGKIVYANLNTSGTNRRIYRFTHGGQGTYFDENGLGIKKSLLRTPIDGARIASGYGNRRHPILGYTRAHRGVDFAAPVGTPFYAAGNGVIAKTVAKCRSGDRQCGGGYGNYIVIRHSSVYSSEYAHISRLAKNIRVGHRVRQGEVIGFVGDTGLATGPHLHYGLLQNNVRIDPSRIKPMSYIKLEGKELARFLEEKRKLDNFKISGETRAAGKLDNFKIFAGVGEQRRSPSD